MQMAHRVLCRFNQQIGERLLPIGDEEKTLINVKISVSARIVDAFVGMSASNTV
jgi:hypothetical protein